MVEVSDLRSRYVLSNRLWGMLRDVCKWLRTMSRMQTFLIVRQVIALITRLVS